MAFIVNIKNKTVVTALNQEESKSNIFTNIDGGNNYVKLDLMEAFLFPKE
ncbi:hypothetical protein [Lachnobacterium bovis]